MRWCLREEALASTLGNILIINQCTNTTIANVNAPIFSNANSSEGGADQEVVPEVVPEAVDIGQLTTGYCYNY